MDSSAIQNVMRSDMYRSACGSFDRYIREDAKPFLRFAIIVMGFGVTFVLYQFLTTWSIMDSCTIFTQGAEQMRKCGFWLAQSIYGPTTLLFSGELGAGKTTFIQGLAEGWGVQETITSPTYALEQRYGSARGPFLHLDLYRMKPSEAATLLHSHEVHEGIRCIEWPERIDADHPSLDTPRIDVSIEEKDDGRQITFRFHDVPFPPAQEVTRWREEVHLPPHIRAHCDAVANLCAVFAETLREQGRPIRPLLLRRAAELHDLFRFIDFRPDAGPADYEEKQKDRDIWNSCVLRYPGLHHEQAAAAFLRQKGYEALAAIIEVHGLTLPAGCARATIEQKILYYADKRILGDRVVTLQERFTDFHNRYANGKQTPQAARWREEVEEVERELGLAST
jgi:tRNA threonylcarbamoyladenosine biosynthesis protein TsaE